MKIADFFAGIGGVKIGFENAGFETVFSNDFEPNCKFTFDLNSRHIKQTTEDIRNIRAKDIPKFEIMAGGFPCQAFSVAGYREGFNDQKGRGNLFLEIIRIADESKIKPEVIFLENVKNLQNHDGGKTYKVIKKTLEEMGYYVKEKVLNSMEYGNAPQNRERIYIVAFKSKEAFDRFSFPAKKKLAVTFKDFLDSDVNEKYYYEGKPLYKYLKDHVISEDTVYQWRRKYVRENKKGVCPTLTANMGMGGHNVPIILDAKGIRKFTPLECFRMQAFPKTYRLPENIADSHLYKQAGNSVTVSVIEAIAKNIKAALDGINTNEEFKLTA